MRRSVKAEPIQTKFCTLTPCADILIYLKRYPYWFRGFGGAGMRKSAFPNSVLVNYVLHYWPDHRGLMHCVCCLRRTLPSREETVTNWNTFKT